MESLGLLNVKVIEHTFDKMFLYFEEEVTCMEFGPSIPKTDPFGISKLTLLRTLAFPKHLLTFSIFTKVLVLTLNP